MKLQRYWMKYDGFDECICEQACDSGSWVQADEAEDAIAERDARIEKLKRVCSVLYFGAEDYLRKLAENEYSGCASTQRKTQTELKELLEGK
jgi:hypothetical protein